MVNRISTENALNTSKKTDDIAKRDLEDLKNQTAHEKHDRYAKDETMNIKYSSSQII